MSFAAVLVWYLLGINVLALLISGWDKLRAIRGGFRVPERTLLLFAWLMGGVGLLLSFFLFHHKTRKRKFMLGVPTIMAVQGVILWMLLR